MEIMLLGDALEQLGTLESESVHTCVTSPPYYNLRDYEVSGQIGMENTPEEYIDHVVAVFREVRRILRSDGTLWLNIGDSYRNKDLAWDTLDACVCPADGWVAFAAGYHLAKAGRHAGKRQRPLHQKPRIPVPALKIPALLFRRGGD